MLKLVDVHAHLSDNLLFDSIEEIRREYLENMEGISRAFIVTDPTMVKLGYVDKALYYLIKVMEIEPKNIL